LIYLAPNPNEIATLKGEFLKFLHKYKEFFGLGINPATIKLSVPKNMNKQLTPLNIIGSSVQSPQVARLEMMLEASRTFNSIFDLQTLLLSIANVATQLTSAEIAAILLLKKDHGNFYWEMFRGDGSEGANFAHIPLKQSLAGRIVKRGEVLVIENLQEERHFHEIDQLAPLAVKSVLGAPLVYKDKTIGVIEVFNKVGGVRFLGDDIHMLNILAGQVATAIENIRFFEQQDRLDMMFNELASPMTRIIGSSEMLLADPQVDTEDVRLGLESINREATRLAQMVNDFMLLTKIETGRIQMRKQMVDIKPLAQEVVNLFYSQALEKKVTLLLRADQPIPNIAADPERLKQVIANLIGNAIQYNHEGGQVEVVLVCNVVRLQVSVRDTGKGIASKDLGLVFDKFYRVANGAASRSAGLGLAVAKKIIEAHHGDIWVQSQVGKGSTFTFSLPLLDSGL
jgi:signal transduction histidine kinase